MGRELTKVAGPGDADRVAELLDDFQREYDEPSPGREQLASNIRAAMERDEGVFLLAPDGVAVVSFRTSVVYGRCALLEELYVAPPARRRGQGRALLEHAMAVARDSGAAGIELNTSEADTAARGLYSAMGFTNLEAGSPMLFYEREL
jgi:ribosomal protein S18 acetylase RimI-like enzyme